MAKIIQKLKSRNNLLTLFILIAILFLGNKLREFSYASVPPPGENADEYAYGWIGLSILQGKAPRAWSAFPQAYSKVDREIINVDQIFTTDQNRPPFELVQPWYDSPPLMGVIASSYAYLKGARSFDQASVILIRRPMLKIALITTILIFILGGLIWGKSVGLLSALIYSISPVMVISSRLVLPENGYTPLLVALIIFMYQYFHTKKIGYWVGALAVGVIALFFKFSGIALLLTLFAAAVVLGEKARAKLLRYTIYAIIIAISLYLLYGYIYNWEIFKNVMINQGIRFYGASSEAFFQAFNASKVTRNLTDGWISLSWVALFIVSFISWNKKEIGPKLLTISFLSYLVIFLLMGSEAYGHYRYPFFPILVISAAKLLLDLIKTRNIPVFLPLLLLPFGTTFHRLVGVVGFQVYVPYFRGFIVLSLALFLLGAIKKSWIPKLQVFFMALVIAFVIFLSAKEIYFYNIDKWYFVN